MKLLRKAKQAKLRSCETMEASATERKENCLRQSYSTRKHWNVAVKQIFVRHVLFLDFPSLLTYYIFWLPLWNGLKEKSYTTNNSVTCCYSHDDLEWDYIDVRCVIIVSMHEVTHRLELIIVMVRHFVHLASYRLQNPRDKTKPLQPTIYTNMSLSGIRLQSLSLPEIEQAN